MNGTVSSAPRRATWKGPAWKRKIAAVGTARSLTVLPRVLMVWPAQSSRKDLSRSRRSTAARVRFRLVVGSIGSLVLDVTIASEGQLRLDDDRDASIKICGGRHAPHFCP